MFRYTCIVFSLNIPALFYPFIFFATLTSYSLHWYLTNYKNEESVRLMWNLRHKKLFPVLFVISFLATLVLFAALKEYYLYLLPLAFITFMYSAPKIPLKPFMLIRKIAVLKTTYLALVWLAVTAILPLLASGHRWDISASLFLINRMFLIFPICVLFDYRDREEDRQDGIKNIATLVSARGLDLVFGVCVSINVAAAVLIFNQAHSLFLALSNILPSVFLALTYKTSKTTKSDLWFYFYLDGLMMLSGILSLPFTL